VYKVPPMLTFDRQTLLSPGERTHRFGQTRQTVFPLSSLEKRNPSRDHFHGFAGASPLKIVPRTPRTPAADSAADPAAALSAAFSAAQTPARHIGGTAAEQRRAAPHPINLLLLKSTRFSFPYV